VVEGHTATTKIYRNQGVNKLKQTRWLAQNPVLQEKRVDSLAELFYCDRLGLGRAHAQ